MKTVGSFQEGMDAMISDFQGVKEVCISSVFQDFPEGWKHLLFPSDSRGGGKSYIFKFPEGIMIVK